MEMGHCTGCAVTHCALTRHPSDGVTFSGVGLTHNCVLSDTSFTDFGAASGLPYNETISDWGMCLCKKRFFPGNLLKMPLLVISVTHF